MPLKVSICPASAVAGLTGPTGYVFAGLVASAVLRNHVDVHACADSSAR